MTGLLDLPNNPLVLFVLVIAVGFFLIIIAAVPSLSIFILKNAGLTLNKRQSIVVAVIGGVLIVIGILGLYYVQSAPPVITQVKIYPYPTATAFAKGTPVNVTVIAEPGSNLFQKIFEKPTNLRYQFELSPHIKGPQIENTTTIQVFPTDKGLKIINISVTDMAKNGSKAPWKCDYNIVLPNQPPIIEDFSPKRIGKRIEITAEAMDPENDIIYYNFYRMPPPPADKFIEIPPQRNYREPFRILMLDENEVDQSILQVCVQDGDMNGTWGDHEPVCENKNVANT